MLSTPQPVAATHSENNIPSQEALMEKILVRTLQNFNKNKSNQLLDDAKGLPNPAKNLLAALDQSSLPDVQAFLDVYFYHAESETSISNEIESMTHTHPDEPAAICWEALLSKDIKTLDPVKLVQAKEYADKMNFKHIRDSIITIQIARMDIPVTHRISGQIFPEQPCYKNLAGANFSNLSLYNLDLNYSNLSGTNFENTELNNVAMNKCNLSNANLPGSRLIHTSMNCSNLSKANLSAAMMVNTSLKEANLSDADLRNAQLGQETFLPVILNDANLTGTNLSGTIFLNVQLDNTRFFVGLNITENGNLTKLLDTYIDILDGNPKFTLVTKALGASLGKKINDLPANVDKQSLYNIAYHHKLLKQSIYPDHPIADSAANSLNKMYRLFSRTENPLIETNGQYELRTRLAKSI